MKSPFKQSNRRKRTWRERCGQGWQWVKDRFPSILRATAIAVVGIGTPLGIFYGYVHVMSTDYFDVDTVNIDGNAHVEAAPLKQAIRLTDDGTAKQNIFNVEPASLEETFGATYPWIRDIDISTRLPDTVNVQIEEFEAKSAIKDDNGFYLASAEGQILEEVEWKKYLEQYQNLPVVTGVNAARESGERIDQAELYERVLSAFEKFRSSELADSRHISEIHVDSVRGISMVFESGTEIRLGDRHLAKRLDKLKEVYPTVEQNKENLGYILLDQYLGERRPEIVVGRFNHAPNPSN